MHDFTVDVSPAKDNKSDIPVLNYSIKAKTYRYVGTTDTSEQTGKAPAASASTNTTVQPK